MERKEITAAEAAAYFMTAAACIGHVAVLLQFSFASTGKTVSMLYC